MNFGCNKWMHVVLFFDNERLKSELYVNLKVVFIGVFYAWDRGAEVT